MNETTAALLDWYRGAARTLPWRTPPGHSPPTDPDWPYRVWLSEIMLQQTTVAAVRDYFAAFTTRWPDVASLAAADDAEVMAAWAGLGYYARARNLLACARTIVSDHAGRFPAGEAALRQLPGIGAYTAAAIAAFAFGARTIVIDGNIERVITRLCTIDTPLPAARADIAAHLETLTPATASDFAQALMDLGARICTPRAPRCDLCPLAPHCAAAASTTPECWPVKPPRRPRPTRHGTTWWIETSGEFLTILRPAKGLLGGMRALPASDWTATATPPAPPLPGDWRHLGAVTHGFTHFELVLQVTALNPPHKPELAGDWLPVAEIEHAGLPTLFLKAARLARAQMETR